MRVLDRCLNPEDDGSAMHHICVVSIAVESQDAVPAALESPALLRRQLGRCLSPPALLSKPLCWPGSPTAGGGDAKKGENVVEGFSATAWEITCCGAYLHHEWWMSDVCMCGQQISQISHIRSTSWSGNCSRARVRIPYHPVQRPDSASAILRTVCRRRRHSLLRTVCGHCTKSLLPPAKLLWNAGALLFVVRQRSDDDDDDASSRSLSRSASDSRTFSSRPWLRSKPQPPLRRFSVRTSLG